MPVDIVPRESKRYSHGNHLTPQDANEDRTRRRRHRHSSTDRERRHHSSERGYRSDNEPRRRHGDDHDRERHRASSSRRSKEKEYSESRTRDSSSDFDQSDSDRRKKRERPTSGRHDYAEHRLHRDPNFVKPREPAISTDRPYGEHWFDDLYHQRREKRPPVSERVVHRVADGDRVPAPTMSGRTHAKRDRMSNGSEPRTLTDRPQRSKREIYGEPRLEYPDGEPLLRTRQMAYGDHHITVDGPGSTEDEFDAHDVTSGHLPEDSAPTPLPESRMKSSNDAHNLASQHNGPRSTPSHDHGQSAHRMSLPSGSRDSPLGPGHRSAQDYHETRPSTAGPGTVPFYDTQLPRLSVSQYPPDFTQSLSNIVTPGDSRSEAGNYIERFRPGSAPSSTSSAIPSRSPSVSGSGVLGSRTYQYQPLKELEFRLVKVLPERMWKLKCEILHVSVDDAPEYTAISYAWGDGVDTRPLLLEGANIPIAVSLHDALKAVRRKKEEVLVWVDALCIDQQNKDERSEQVRLMGHIYSRAMSVAIWIGPDFEESELAVQLLQKMAQKSVDPQRIKSFHKNPDSLALFNLFKRDYWKRLWVVQEVSLAKNKMVYCGYSMFPWDVYRQAAEIFWDKDSDPHIRQGPTSFPELETLWELGDESLLEVMRACRKKLSENPRDKVFGVLGMLPEATQREFPVDYSQSVKTVYMDVVDYLISTTDQLDVIRESIHFPLHVNSLGLPTWCPDWSHIPEVSGIGRTFNFAASRCASGPTKAQYRFHDERRKLEISAIKLDSIMATGVAVGTFCAAQDYLTAFLQWRAVLLHELKIEDGNESHPMHAAFCRTLCLGQVPEDRSQPQVWRDLCYHVFASLIRERLPRLPVDEDLRHYADATGLIEPDARRKFLQDHFGNRMMGRSLCITEGGLVGMGSGYMTAGDIVVVPFGCSTPILLRPENRLGEYRYVGDIYIDGYMHGEAVAQMEAKDPKRVVSTYKLC